VASVAGFSQPRNSFSLRSGNAIAPRLGKLDPRAKKRGRENHGLFLPLRSALGCLLLHFLRHFFDGGFLDCLGCGLFLDGHIIFLPAELLFNDSTSWSNDPLRFEVNRAGASGK
jgi:hypothetical protein